MFVEGGLKEAIEKINQYAQPLGMAMPLQNYPSTWEEVASV